MSSHFAAIVALILLVVVCMFRPFLPGGYDPLAVTLSFMAQLLAFAGLLLVPVGVLWWIAEARWAARGEAPLARGSRRRFALVALVGATLVGLVVCLPAFFNGGASFGLGALALLVYGILRAALKIRRANGEALRGVHPAPLYLVCLPVAALLFRLALIPPAVAYSRELAIHNSAQMIADIEAYHTANGHYPPSLVALWKDYKPAVIGIQHYHYEPSREAYNLFFEQFAADLATREIVVYNRLDEQEFTSHDSWILVLSPDELVRARGYFAVHQASTPHWKYFWFD